MGDQKVTPSFHLPPLKFSATEEEIPPENYLNSDVYKLEEPKSFPNFRTLPFPPAIFWKHQTLKSTLDVIQINFKPDGVRILFFERYPEAETKAIGTPPLCDPLLGCAKTVSLLRITF